MYFDYLMTALTNDQFTQLPNYLIFKIYFCHFYRQRDEI